MVVYLYILFLSKFKQGGDLMLNTIKSEKSKLLVDTTDLKLLLGCGRATAVSIGVAAGAKIRINRRVLWNMERVKEYINNIAE